MIDKDLFKLLGKNKKYIFIVDALMIISLILNLGITGIICLKWPVKKLLLWAGFREEGI